MLKMNGAADGTQDVCAQHSPTNTDSTHWMKVICRKYDPTDERCIFSTAVELQSTVSHTM